MKLFLFTFLAVAFNCMAQNGIALYGLEYTADTPNARMQGIANEMGNMQLELKFNNDRSFSKILKSIPKDIHSYNVAKIIVGADEPYQQQDNQSITIRNFQNEKFLIDYSLRLKNWDITSEEVTINGFKCFKAINKIKNNRSGNENTITAWFSPDIPASYGPLGFGGLPGLIVELDYKYCIFKLEKLTLNLEDIKVEIMENYPLISAEEYVSKIRSSRMVTPD